MSGSTPIISRGRFPGRLVFETPKTPEWSEIASKVGAWWTKSGWTCHSWRLSDLIALGAVAGEKSGTGGFTLSGGIHSLKIDANTPADLRKYKTSQLFLGGEYLKRNVSLQRKNYDTNFQAAKIDTVYDLLTTVPMRFIDRSTPTRLEDLVAKEEAVVIGKIVDVSSLTAKTPAVVFTVEERSGKCIDCIFWRQEWLRRKFTVGSNVAIVGTVGFFRRKINLSGKSIDFFDMYSSLPVVPIYRQFPSIGLNLGVLAALIREAVASITNPKLAAVFRNFHFPSNLEKQEKARSVLAQYELINLLLIQSQREQQEEKAVTISAPGKLAEKLLGELSWEPTKSQKTAISQFRTMLAGDNSGNGLLIGDVGSGKTLVSEVLAADAIESGYQVAFMAPTSVLATQIYESATEFFRPESNIRVELFDNSAKAAVQRQMKDDLKNGSINILVGTVGVSNNLQFKNLGFVCIDEEQKFGVEQRQSIISSRDDGFVANVVSQTATPIPRTVAKWLLSDPVMMEMKEKPAGRLPIETLWLRENSKDFCTHPSFAWEDIKSEVHAGHRALVVAPLVYESDAIDASSVEATAETLSKGVLKDCRVDFVHGKMSKEEQRQKVQDIKSGKTDVLVGSAVIEIGVDIRDATRIVILSPERMGISSLHQIRGRVGRNSIPSRCYLVSDTDAKRGTERLEAMVNSGDGFKLAKIDTVVRGEGDVLGKSQNGATRMKFFNLADDVNSDIMEVARDKVQDIENSPDKDRLLADAKTIFLTEEEDELW